jgi:hypothetical protein
VRVTVSDEKQVRIPVEARMALPAANFMAERQLHHEGSAGLSCLLGVPWASRERCFSFAVLGVMAERYNWQGICSVRPRMSEKVASITSMVTTFDDVPAHLG